MSSNFNSKKSFILYLDQRGLFDKLPDQMAGKLIKHIFKYVNLEKPTAEDLIIDVAFESIKQSLKRDLNKYEKRAENSRANGSKGGRPRKEEKINQVKKETQETQRVFLEPKKPDSVSVSDSVSVIKNKKQLLDKSSDLDLTKEVFVYWLKTMDKNGSAKFTAQRKQKIIARLRSGYTVDQIKTAIFNCANNSFNMGQNESGKVYDDLTLICRDDTKLEQYINDTPVKNQRSAVTQQNISSLSNWTPPTKSKF